MIRLGEKELPFLEALNRYTGLLLRLNTLLINRQRATTVTVLNPRLLPIGGRLRRAGVFLIYTSFPQTMQKNSVKE